MHNQAKRLAAYQDLAAFTRQPKPPLSTKYRWPLFSDIGHYLSNPDTKKVTEVTVESGDTLEITQELKSQGFRPLVLNMACVHKPGGGWEKGTGAQEESLFYRSVYYQTLSPHFYPLDDASAVYSPEVTVFRDTELNNLRGSETWQADFIAVAALRHPKLTGGGQQGQPDVMRFADVRDLELTRRKLELIFQVGLQHGHDSLVLSAFGCGAYRNPPGAIIGLFNELLAKYDGCFQKVVFAILSPKETAARYRGSIGMDNLELFQRGIRGTRIPLLNPHINGDTLRS